MDNSHSVHFRSLFVVLAWNASDSPDFLYMVFNSSGNLAQMFYPLLFPLIAIKNF